MDSFRFFFLIIGMGSFRFLLYFQKMWKSVGQVCGTDAGKAFLREAFHNKILVANKYVGQMQERLTSQE
uniref:Uncharacterized protein n=1 Tax=Nelumbo nucifera TaxID=4432 RepID=A0A822Y947_NELNU|nr:TPA_asm: hypothetical protein HUJ06_029174 [Nelumbo nucifera]